MKLRALGLGLFLAVLPAWVGLNTECTAQPKIDPDAAVALKRMFDCVKEMPSGRLGATHTAKFTTGNQDPRPMTSTFHWEVSFARPGKFRMQTSGNGSVLLACDGKTLRLPKGKGKFDEVAAPDNLSDLMRTLPLMTMKYFLSAPYHFCLLDLFDNDTCDNLMRRAHRLTLEGVEEIDGQACDHLRMIVEGQIPAGFEASMKDAPSEEQEEYERIYKNKRIALDFWITKTEGPLLKQVRSMEKSQDGGGMAMMTLVFEEWEPDADVSPEIFLLKDVRARSD